MARRLFISSPLVKETYFKLINSATVLIIAMLPCSDSPTQVKIAKGQQMLVNALLPRASCTKEQQPVIGKEIVGITSVTKT